ncbi:LexA family transcriptional regulator [Allorhizobium sp. BGMRC 0089]|uniref:LexA family transcriptional regulator n=1 Tax=Allorhizobium sonneratiae TaxID=2934936 RepID=UPI002034191D|nr:LexA family transcriptional regulator [Allorhizobium sonneratiae]MCM2293063.1 LexA family transcriptional regulator [Allorhizobium sonneratiae]
MEEPRHRLQRAREAAGFSSPTEAARAFKGLLGKDLLISNENGNRPISRKAAEKYAEAFGVRAGWILYGESENLERSDIDVPLVSMVSATNLRDQDGVSEHEIIRRIKVGELPKGDWVALQVEGDSMNRIAPDGAIILVDRSDDVLLDGRYYVFVLDGGAATFKMYRRASNGYPNRMVPYSTNPDHMAIPADRDDLYVFGRVKRIIQDV